jgi:hypothetical protein
VTYDGWGLAVRDGSRGGLSCAGRLLAIAVKATRPELGGGPMGSRDSWAFGKPYRPVVNRRRKFFSVAVALTAFFTFAMAAVALASAVDESIVDTTAPTGSVTLAPGGSAAIAINLSVTGRQENPASFQVYRDFTLSGGTFVGSNPQTFNVSPRAATDPPTTFSTTGTVTVDSGQADGAFTLAVHAISIVTTAPAALSVGTSSNYSVTVETPTPADTTPPDISYALNPASPDGADGWYTSDVTLTWTVTENESPSSLVTTGCDDQNITADQAETTYSCSATSDGGSAGPVDVSIKRDATKPTNVAFTGGSITDGGTYYFGSVPAGPTGCTADDATSGVASCVVTGGGNTVGPHSYTATATDNAGNVEIATLNYTVLSWDLRGFFQPVDMSGVWNAVKGGSTVPLKFEVFAAAELTDTAVVDSFTVKGVACPDTGATTDDIELVTTGGTSLRYDSTSGQFIQNWQTPKKPGSCYAVTLKTDDGSSISANFKLK